MTINERIQMLRKEYRLSQGKFGERIGLKQGAVSNMEKEGRTVLEQNIRLICDAFKVNEQWLRDGEGDMFVNDDDFLLSQIVKEYNLDGKWANIIKCFLSLTDDQREAILFAAEKVVEANKAAARDADVAAERAAKEKELAAAKEQVAKLSAELGIDDAPPQPGDDQPDEPPPSPDDERREQGKTRKEWHQFIDDIFDEKKETSSCSNLQDFDDATKIKRRAAR